MQRVTSPNPAHGVVDSIRTWYTVVILMIGFLGAVLGLKSREDKKQHYAILAIAAVIMVTSAVMAFSYTHEIIDRTYLFGIPLISYFATRLLPHKVTSIILCLFLIGAPVIYTISHYGNQYTDWAPQSNLEGLEFFNENATNSGTLTGNYLSWGVIIGSDPLAAPYNSPPASFLPTANFIEHPELYTGVLYEQLHFSDNKVSMPDVGSTPFPHYIAISQRDKSFYYWIWNKLPFINQIEQSLEKATNNDLVYSSPGMKIYVSEK